MSAFSRDFAATAGHRKLNRPVHLILDWDGTLTVNDTMALLGELPKAKGQRLHEKQIRVNRITNKVAQIKGTSSTNPALDPSPPFPTGQKWTDITEAYIKDYEAHKASHSLVEYATPEEYTAWLNSLHPVEYGSADRVSQSGFFTGVTAQDVRNVVTASLDNGSLQFRSGWETLFEPFLPRVSDGPPKGSKVAIVSVNFSTYFIRHSLWLAATRLTEMPEGRRTTLMEYISNMDIMSNEIHGLDDLHGSSGTLIGQIRTAEDKARYMRALTTASSSPEAQEAHALVVYVGDSATDYLCLRQADVGVWVCNCEESEVSERFARAFKPLDVRSCTPPSITEMDADWVHEGSWCLWARDLGEVADFLERTGVVGHEAA